jgi:hypothetical protein
MTLNRKQQKYFGTQAHLLNSLIYSHFVPEMDYSVIELFPNSPCCRSLPDAVIEYTLSLQFYNVLK